MVSSRWVFEVLTVAAIDIHRPGHSNACSMIAGWVGTTGRRPGREMQRVLTSKPRRAGSPLPEPTGDGGDSPAWSRKRGSYERPDERPGARLSSVPVRRTARPLGVQLPRRGQHAGGARRGGRPAGPAGHRADRPRRVVRGGAIRRGGQGTGRAHGVRRRTVAGQRAPHRGCPIRPDRTCWCWPAGRRATDGCRGSSPRRTWPAGRRASRATTSTR